MTSDNRAPRMADVARHAGVSVATVSRALSGTRQVAPELVERVSRAAEDLGYRINLVGRTLRQTKSSTVGLIVPDLDNPFFSTLAQHLARAFHEPEIDLLVYSADGSLGTEMRGVHSFLGRQVDALVMIPVHESDSAAAVELAASAVPTAQLDRRVPSERAHFVGVNNRRGMDLVAEHIATHVDQDRQPVVFVAGTVGASSSQERLQGFQHHFGTEARVMLGHFSVEWGQTAAQTLLDDGWQGATVVAAADVIALGVLAGLLHAGVSVPDDFRVIGFDGLGVANFAYPSLATVRQPVEAMANAVRDLVSNPDQGAAGASLRPELFDPAFVDGATSP